MMKFVNRKSSVIETKNCNKKIIYEMLLEYK